MEFEFDVNAILPDFINKFDCSLKINSKSFTSATNKELRLQLLQVIDDIGKASAKAQELQTPVTSAEKFLASEHIIYLMKDRNGNKGKGTVVGILKMGHKKLFLLDMYGNLNEMHPLCVLDFYIHESQQRKGYGRKLFEHMLADEHIEAHELAIDRPSSKFLFFLNKYYHLNEVIPQVNKFTIFKEFFPSDAYLSSPVNSDLHFDKNSEDCHNFSSGRHKPYDSSLNIFGVPASWNQPSSSISSQQPVQQ